MDNNIIQAYLWQEVIRLAFSPSGDGNIQSWLHQYNKNLKEFWEVDEYPQTPTPKTPFKASLSSSLQINMLLDYNISNIGNFTVNFLHEDSTKSLLWTHDVDSQYFTFPQQIFLTDYNQRNLAINNMSQANVENIVDSLLLHPRVHQHIKSPIDNHNIRIGGGIDNPFVFLFHLRYQLCPDGKKREDEKYRLINLFETAMKAKARNISANDLLSAN